MFLKNTLTNRKDQDANSEAEAEAAADMAACTGEVEIAISVLDAVDTAEAAAEAVEAVEAAADAGIHAVGTREAAEEEGNLPSTLIFY